MKLNFSNLNKKKQAYKFKTITFNFFTESMIEVFTNFINTNHSSFYSVVTLILLNEKIIDLSF